MRRLLSLCVLFALVSTSFAQKAATFLRLGSKIVEQKATLRPATPEERVSTLRKLFTDAGCQSDRLVEQPVPGNPPNLLCSTHGTSDSIILVLAPSDYTSKGDEAGVQWGDLAMLPILAESIGSVLTRHTLVFVAVSGTKKDEAGAKAYLEKLTPDQRQKIHAVVAFDHIGRSPLAYAVPGTEFGQDVRQGRYHGVAVSEKWDPSQLPITRSIPAAAERWGISIPIKNDEFGSKDTKPFRREGIPAVTFTSPAWVVTGYVGNNPLRDYRTSIDFKEYDKTYLFLCAYLIFLDRDLGKALPAPSAETTIATAAAPPAATRSETPAAVPSQAAPSAALPVATVVAAGAPTPAAAPSTPPLPTTSTPVFRATTRLVQVDVVVTDHNGQPIPKLQKQEFTLLQDGRPQEARVFEEHAALDAAQASPANAKAQPAPHYLGATYSNQPEAANTQSRTILLFDMLNTPLEDQQWARKQLEKVAKSLPPHQPVALFALTDRLIMVQAFADSPDSLQRAMMQLQSQHSQLLTTEAERQRVAGRSAYIAFESVGNVPTNSQGVASMQDDIASRSLLAFKTTEIGRTDQRVNFTLEAFAGLARSVAGYPGRKNVIWLSGGFPVRVAPDPAMKDEWRSNQDYRAKLSQTVALLTQARIAVYPVDIRGMQIKGIDISTGSAESVAYVGGTDVRPGATSNDKMSSLLASQSFTAMNERESMTEVAEQTGGHAFINTNDLGGALTRAMNDGSHYYTLAYTPDTKDEPATYHRIEVKLNRSDAKLSYRRGYYSEPKVSTPQAGLLALQSALQPGMPPSTMLFFTASTKLPDAPNQPLLVKYVVNTNNVTFEDTESNGKHVVLDCMVIAFDKEGKEAAHASNTLDGTIPGSMYEAMLSSGVPATQELDLKPGVYNLRVGVQDRVSQRIGTLDIPITVP